MTTAVVKLGGSLLADAAFDALLGVAEARGSAVVVGGGRFADAVRAEQRRLGYGDAAAHEMAILAMEQTARLVADRAPGLVPCATLGAFRRARRQGRGALWRPFPMALDAPSAASWDVTSDTLALWLAGALDADALVLVKSVPSSPRAGPAVWAADGLVDAAFPAAAAAFSGRIACLGPDPAALEAALDASERTAA